MLTNFSVDVNNEDHFIQKENIGEDHNTLCVCVRKKMLKVLSFIT